MLNLLKMLSKKLNLKTFTYLTFIESKTMILRLTSLFRISFFNFAKTVDISLKCIADVEEQTSFYLLLTYQTAISP